MASMSCTCVTKSQTNVHEPCVRTEMKPFVQNNLVIKTSWAYAVPGQWFMMQERRRYWGQTSSCIANRVHISWLALAFNSSRFPLHINILQGWLLLFIVHHVPNKKKFLVLSVARKYSLGLCFLPFYLSVCTSPAHIKIKQPINWTYEKTCDCYIVE